MYFKQFYLGCLSHASYLLGSKGEAVVIDPQRDVEQYIEEAEDQGFKIKYVILTHLHADFVSGHIELAQRSQAQIVFCHIAKLAFEHLSVKDGDVLKVGSIELEIMETPGHTPESMCILARDGEDLSNPQMLFSGDTLFIGDVGRPDLVGAKGFSKEEMASMMYDSLHNKILKLDDMVEVHPAHGAGSLCGKHLSSESSSTIGKQKQVNYALKPMDRANFIELLTSDLPEVPAYFPHDVEMNSLGPVALDQLTEVKTLTPSQVKKAMMAGVTLIDVRSNTAFAAGHIAGSLNIGLSGQFASWAGTLIDIGYPIVLVANDMKEIDEAVVRLARIGHENVLGCLDDGLSQWKLDSFELEQTPIYTVAELRTELQNDPDLSVVDVRRIDEYSEGHIRQALNLPLSNLIERLPPLDKGKPVVVICASGYRSSIAKGLFEKAGFKNIGNVIGGMKAWQEAGFEVTTNSALSEALS